MVRLLLLILTTCSLSWAAILPPGFGSLFRRAEDTQGRPCQQVASAVLALVNKAVEEQTTVPVKRIIKFATDVDIDNRAQVEEIVCQFIEGSTEDYVAYVQSNGLQRTAITRIYDYVVVALDENKKRVSPNQAEHRLITLILQSGFTELDPQGVAQWRAIVEEVDEAQGRPSSSNATDLFGSVPERDTPVPCSELQSALMAVVMEHPDLAADLGPYPIFMIVSPDKIPGLLCDVILADSIDEIINVINSMNLHEKLIDAAKLQIAGLQYSIPFFESQLQSLKDMVNTAADDGWVQDAIDSKILWLDLCYSLRDAGMMPDTGIPVESSGP